jgi:SAM-dependent methyltransferase
VDLIVSNDVFEHVPDPWQAFRECRRVLREGGAMLATLPFYDQEANSRPRARLSIGGIEHLLPAQYHGNPVSADGSLVFTDFGWDVLDRLREAGFRNAAFEAYVSPARGHLGGVQLVLRAQA